MSDLHLSKDNKKVIPGSKDSQNHKSKSIFSGLAFKGDPVSEEEFKRHYQEYVARCSGEMKTDDNHKILREFSEVDSIEVKCDNNRLLLEGSPAFIKFISLDMEYTVRYKDGSAVRLIGDKTYSKIDNSWKLLN
ncbi:hypothetical protein LZY01_23790 [Levilactobacillus zymae]|uniref:Uncharacterized protein n=1 Tax=Levilactobacillus zymae TaxID=267363 RepID=A0ABQ0WZG8_9LACO|nr:hypothetical protein [Levilactobacillus zymae]QFR61045.1 hypothetical protein LZ395_05670 [Levilactobacillus zymae]GEO73211.1 hypothetical protein LZY01_23790 [Levilactobacillus zymae]